jgi:hypothetical protein
MWEKMTLRKIEYVEKALDGGKTPRHNVLLVQF